MVLHIGCFIENENSFIVKIWYRLLTMKQTDEGKVTEQSFFVFLVSKT